MKKQILLLMVAFFLSTAFAAINDYVPIDHRSAFTVTNSESGQMNIHFTLPEYTIENVNVGDNIFQRVSIKDAGLTMEDGLPELPYLTITLAIPRQGSPHLTMLNSQAQTLENFNVYPVQEGLALEQPKGFVYNADFYQTNNLYPQSPLECGDPYILRDFRLLNIQVNPFSYDAVNQQLTVNQNMDFVLDFTAQAGINELEGEYSAYSPSFSKIYEANIYNFNDYRYMVTENIPPRYLIIYGNNSDQNFQNALDDFVLWKKQKGADVDVASTVANQAGSSTTTIKNYIQAQYNNPSTRPDYVILIGDTSGSYTIPCFTQDGGASDYAYTHLAGNDNVGDVMIGRISVENLSQFQTLLAKIYLYERDINIVSASWLEKMLLVGDTSPSGQSCVYLSKFIKELALKLNPNYTFTELYSADPSPASMNTAINQGVGFFSYRGYINMSGWSPSESLSNSYKLLHAVIPTCATGNFSGTATSESFIRLGTATMPKGAVTAVGMATSSTKTITNNALHGGTFGGILAYGMRTMGEAVLNGKTFIHNVMGSSNAALSFKHSAWYNLMGDPTMEVYCAIPKTFSALTPTTIVKGNTLMDITVLDGDLDHVADASVTLSQSGSIISRGFTDANGEITLGLPTVLNSSNCVLTISKHDFKPVQVNITVDDSGTLVPGVLVVDDDNMGASQGNDDGMANGGETIELQFGINNSSIDAIGGVNGYILSESPYITIIDSLVSYGTIEAGQLAFNFDPVSFHISQDIPHNAMVRFTLNLTDDQGTQYVISDQLLVTNAKMMYHSYMVINAGTNNALDPGETGGLRVTLSNIGALGITDLYARLYSDNDLVTVNSHTVYYGDMLQNVQVTPMDEAFGLYARPQVLPGMIIPMRIKLYNDEGFEQWLYFTFSVGSVTVNDPLGPDEYGYVIYDDGDVFYPECPVYDWVGIAPAEGGIGTALAITDTYASGNEGDQVGSNSLAVVTLPFPFQFYGESYSQITVCSNGFLAFGVSENGEFRNYRLPGPMGPSPMIAPFWDDLATHTGSGIYTWFDRSNHAFVIEWYNMRNGANGSSPETFQVILYDPAVHAGSLGDGPIKIQYHTFNNVDATTSVPGHHGRHATIGIKNQMSNIGLEYSFANTYPTAASPLGNSRALYITNIPVHYEAPHIVVGETVVHDSNGNGECEPGEIIELGVELSNIGNTVAEQINTVLTCNSPYISFTASEAEYYPIDGEGIGYNRTPFVFQISPSCPDGTVLEFNIAIVSGEDYNWSRSFSLRVEASHLEYLGFLINDADAIYDGVIEPNENVKLAINVKNNSAVAARALMATLSAADPNILIGEPIIFKDLVAANDIMQFVFDLSFNLDETEGSYKPLQFNVSNENGQPMSTTIMVPFNMNNIFSDFETENGGFVPAAGWTWGTPTQPGITPPSGLKVWATNLSGNYPDSVTWDLHTPVYALQTGSQLKFLHRYAFENGFDGGNVAISTNNGNTWSLITPVGGYTHNSLVGLNAQPGFSGTISNWQPVIFDLSQYANQMVRFRFRLGADGSTEANGWFIDNFELSGVDQKTGYINGNVILTSDADVSKTNVRANTFYSTNPDETGFFTLYLPNGTHNITASLQNHQSSTINNINISPAAPSYSTEFTLIYLPKPADFAFSVIDDDETIVLTWDTPQDAVYPVMGYYVYKRFNSGPFIRVIETISNRYEDQVGQEGIYQYYVTTRFLNFEGAPTEIANISIPWVSVDDPQSPELITSLAKNYPNPFNPTTTISFDLAHKTKVKLSVYNVKGQLVRNLVNEELMAGNHKVIWNGTDSNNRSVASGVYYYRLESKNYSKTHKMILMK